MPWSPESRSCAGTVANGSLGGEPLELRPVGDPLLEVADVLDGDGGGLGGGDAQLRPDRGAEDGEKGPGGAEHRHEDGRGAPVAGGDPGDPDRGDRQQHQDRQRRRG